MTSVRGPALQPPAMMPSASPAAAARRCLVALAFLLPLVAVGVGAASTAWTSPVLPLFEGCVIGAVGVVLTMELRPAVIVLRASSAAIRYLRRQLDALPETAHPLGA